MKNSWVFFAFATLEFAKADKDHANLVMEKVRPEAMAMTTISAFDHRSNTAMWSPGENREYCFISEDLLRGYSTANHATGAGRYTIHLHAKWPLVHRS